MQHSLETIRQKERVLLVIIDFKADRSTWTNQQMELEMRELVVACGGDVVDTINVPVNIPTAGFLITAVKAKDIADLVTLKQADTVIFSYDLKGSQQRNLEEVIGKKTIDRTQLILDIFAKNASSEEGKMQVELAQLQYLRPRLTGKGIELSRQGGGIGALGPGETKLESDRRRIDQRIKKLSDELENVVKSRKLKRKKRTEEGVPVVSLVGYTNAGKSTLLNTLTDAGQVTKNGFFTTLDPLSRQLMMPNHQKVIVSDTVGFMNDLPHHLIESFKATLEEVKFADVLLCVLDISDPNFKNHHQAVMDVLKQLEVDDKHMIFVLNKIDQVADHDSLNAIKQNFKHAVCISAAKRINIDLLLVKIMEHLSSAIVEIDVHLPMDRMDLVNLAHQSGQVISIKYYNDSIHVRASLPSALAGKFRI